MNLKIIVSIIFLVVAGNYATAQTPIYFSPTGAGTGTGASWTVARQGTTANIQTALKNGNIAYFKAGTYTITAGVLATGLTNGVTTYNIRGGYPSGASGVDTSGYNPNANQTIFDGGSTAQILGSATNQSITLTVKGIIFQNGKGAATSGPGVFNFNGPSSGSATIYFGDCSFINNTNPAFLGVGGAIALAGSASAGNLGTNFSNCYFSGNSVPGTGSGGGGGALYLGGWYGTTNITNSSFSGNTASQNTGGGAIYILNSAATVASINISNSSFCSNTAPVTSAGAGAGGAINFSNNTNFKTSLNISNTNFVNNLAYAQGGAVYLIGGQGIAASTWNNVVFYGNQKAYNHAGNPYPASTADVFDGQGVISGSYSPLTITNTGFQTTPNSTNYPYVTLGSGNYLNSTNPLSSGCPSAINTAAVALSGTVWNDANANKTIDGTEAGTNTGNTLYVNLVDVTTGTVYKSAAVASDGTYSGLTEPLGGDTYKLVLSTSSTATSAGPLPSGWSNTGQSVGSNTATQSGTLGQIELPTSFGSGTLSAQNFGIRLPTTISGTIWDDADGSITINGSEAGTNAGGTFVNLVDVTTNTVTQSVAVASNGTYSGLTTYFGGDVYKLVLSTSASSTSAGPLPGGWVNTGESIGSNTATQSGTLGQIELPTTASATTLTAQNFGIEQKPTANSVSGSNVNPGGTNTVQVPTLNGTDPEQGTLSGASNTTAVIINTLPANGILYYNGATVSAGNVISGYNPALLNVDPNDNITTLTFTYSEVDAASVSSSPATVTITFTAFGISGNVYNDANGLADNNVNGTGTNAGGLNAILVNTLTNTVIATTSVSSSGSYSFANILTALTASVRITTNTATVGSAPPAVALPAGWINTGEHLGSGAGSDGTVDGLLSLGLVSINQTNANFGITQAGYIYVHKKTLDEASSTDFTFSVSGGATAVPNFSLNDNPAQTVLNDIGASQNGRLWVITQGNVLYYRDMGSTVWTQTSVTNASRVDGGAGNSCYYTTTTGSVVYYDGTTTTIIGTTASYGNSNSFDIGSAWDSQPYIVNAAGAIYRYSGSGTTWNLFSNTRVFRWLDGNPATGGVVASANASPYNIYSYTSAGVETGLGIPSNATSSQNVDIGIDGSGTIYVIYQSSTLGNPYVYQWSSGTTWSAPEVTARGMNNITGGPGAQMWSIYRSNSEAPYGNIFSRSTGATINGTNIWWLDDERVRTSPANGNSAMIAVVPGTYTVTETVPSGWDLQAITLYDPTSNSTSSVAGNTATLNVAAGETVHAVVQNGVVNTFTMTSSCANAYTYDFGTGSTGTYGAPLTGQTSYHYKGNYGTSYGAGEGIYKIVSVSTDLYSSAISLFDHTSGNGTGRMMAVDAGYSVDEFFRRRFTGLVVGATYNFSAWIASLSFGINPNVSFQVIDPTNYNVLASNTTGNIATPGVWNQYTLSFTATATSIDLVLVNNAIGGSGNDLALDDISFSMVPISIGALTTSITYNPSSGCSVSGNLQYTSPTGSSYLYSKDGTNYQSGTTFSTLTPGIYTTYVTYSGTTGCASSHVDTVLASVCGNVYDDANGLNNNTISGTGSNAGGTLNLVLYDNTAGKVSAVTAVAADGTYSTRAGIFNDSYTTYLTTAAATVGQAAAPAVTLPSGWASVGEKLGTGTGSDGTVNSILPVGSVSANVTNANFGIDQLPSGTDLIYIISTPTRGSTHALTNAYRNLLPLTYYDPEDCQSVCPDNFGVIIQSLGSMNGNQLAYNGINITPSNVPYTIANYKPDSLTITFNQLGVSSFSFYYKLIDAAGVQSIDPIYTVSWGSNVLAVNLLGFTAQQQGSKAVLKWSTATGSAKDKFTIERSGNGSNWTALATVNGTGNTTTKQDYSYTDNSPLNGDNYYRIQQKDNSGSSSYSETKLLKFGEEWKVSLYPNPVAAGNTVKLISNLPVKQVRITDLQGRTVMVKSMPSAATQGGAGRQLDTSNLTAGSYLVQVISNSGQAQVIKLIKAN